MHQGDSGDAPARQSRQCRGDRVAMPTCASRSASARMPMRQRGNAEVPARRCRCTSVTTPRRQRGDAEESVRQFLGASVALSLVRGAAAAPPALRHGVGTSPRLYRLLVPESAVFFAARLHNVYQRAHKPRQSTKPATCSKPRPRA
jgi:hypothetical protein